MSDRHGGSAAAPRSPGHTDQGTAFVNMLQNHAPTTAQLIGLLAVVITAGLLLLITGVIITATVIGLILFSPLIIVSSPIWVPVGSVLFLALAGFVATCVFGVTAAAVMSWGYRYFKGFHPVGSERVDYARDRIYDTASHVKDYAREYGGYLHSKVKDAAPGA